MTKNEQNLDMTKHPQWPEKKKVHRDMHLHATEREMRDEEMRVFGMNWMLDQCTAARDAMIEEARRKERERIVKELSSKRKYFTTQPSFTNNTKLVSPPREHDMVDWQDIKNIITPDVTKDDVCPEN